MTAQKLNESSLNQSSTRYIPVPQWNQHHAWPPQGGLRHLIFHEKTNGFASAFKRVGRRVLIDESEFLACIERLNGVTK